MRRDGERRPSQCVGDRRPYTVDANGYQGDVLIIPQNIE